MKTNIEGSSEPIELEATARVLTVYERAMRKRIRKIERRIDVKKFNLVNLEAAS